jgi:hypothetical protein
LTLALAGACSPGDLKRATMPRPIAPHIAGILFSLLLPACAAVVPAAFVVTASDGSTHSVAGADAAWKEAVTASAAADIPCAGASVLVVSSSVPYVNEYGQMLSGRATVEGCGQRVSYDLVSDVRFSSNHCVLTGRIPLAARPGP